MIMSKLLPEDWHHLPLAKVLNLLETDPEQGLHPLEVERRQQKYGPNELTLHEGKGPLIIFLEQFNQPLVYILMAAAVITALLKDWVEMWVILAVVLINALIGFVQEVKATQAMAALARSVQSGATVIRAGQKLFIAATDLVPGDVVLLQSGDKVPADLRLLEVRGLRISEATLTGESLPVEKQPLNHLPMDRVLADRVNLAFASSLVTYGTGKGVVVAIGDRTEIGQINELIATADVLATPLTKQIDEFGTVLLKVILSMSALALSAGIIRGYPLEENFLGVIAFAVAAIPEGLPAAVTIALAIGVSRMAKKNAIIRKLPAVETLGSTTIICSDKTGTLTQNEMTVQAVYAGYQEFVVTGVGYAPDGEIVGMTHLPTQPALQECLVAGLLCNDAQVRQAPEGWEITGDPTEAALITVAQKAGLQSAVLTQQFPRQDALPFESEHQYMATLHELSQSNANHKLVYIKGSVERLLPRCTYALSATGGPVPLQGEVIHLQVDGMASQGLRVLAFARREVPLNTQTVDHDTIAQDLTFLGLQGMLDPPRSEAIQAVRACQAAGIQVKMITGDHLGTAAAIGRRIGLTNMGEGDGPAQAIAGALLATVPDAELPDQAERTAVFARVTPEQKLRLVKALQARGNVVAMTGDGVNDAPALRQADIGIAMGITGTEVAKEAAAMVLTDDNFATIEAAVEEGRSVYDNIIKFVVWALPTNLSEGLVVFISMLFGVTLPILPLQILWINTTTAVLLGTGLAFEPKEPGIMQRPPRPPQMPLLKRFWVRRVLISGSILCSFAFLTYEVAMKSGNSLESARTAAVNAIVFGEVFLLLNCRSLKFSMFQLGVFSNPIILIGIILIVFLQLLFTYAPSLQRVFGTASINAEEWVLIFTLSLALYVVIEVDKWIHRSPRN